MALKPAVQQYLLDAKVPLDVAVQYTLSPGSRQVGR
jgi:hypothetical protein